MPVTVDREETHWLIRVEGEFHITSAAELKSLLLEGLASGKKVEVELEHASEIDTTLFQLLWAAGREPAWQDAGIVGTAPEAVAAAARDAGFERFPGVSEARASDG